MDNIIQFTKLVNFAIQIRMRAATPHNSGSNDATFADKNLLWLLNAFAVALEKQYLMGHMTRHQPNSWL